MGVQVVLSQVPQTTVRRKFAKPLARTDEIPFRGSLAAKYFGVEHNGEF